jgi:tetratricopeptide (TPR) repeat protein
MVLAIEANLLEVDGDFIGALARLQESATLSTKDSSPILWQGLLLLRAGYVREAIATLAKAQAMDPLAGINTGYLAIARLSVGQNEEAEALARRALSQGWNPAIFVIIYDLAARGQHGHAVALWDELAASIVTKEGGDRGARIRQALLDPNTDISALLQSKDARSISVELGIITRRFDLILDLADQVRQQKREDRRRQFWLRIAWLPSTLAFREDPRFFAFAEDLGIVRLWEARGYPDGCRRVKAAESDHLACEEWRP